MQILVILHVYNDFLENKNLKIETYLVETDQLNAGMSSKISNKKVLNEKILKKTVNRIVNYCN